MKKVLQVILLIVVFGVMAYPLAWMIGLSLRTGDGVSARYYASESSAGKESARCQSPT